MPMPPFKVRPEDFHVTGVRGLPTASPAASPPACPRPRKDGPAAHEALERLAAAPARRPEPGHDAGGRTVPDGSHRP